MQNKIKTVGIAYHVDTPGHDCNTVINKHLSMCGEVSVVFSPAMGVHEMVDLGISAFDCFPNLGKTFSIINPYIDLWKEPITVYKDKNDTTFSLKSKILKVYRDNNLKIVPSQINKDIQECMTRKRVHIYI